MVERISIPAYTPTANPLPWTYRVILPGKSCVVTDRNGAAVGVMSGPLAEKNARRVCAWSNLALACGADANGEFSARTVQ